MSNLVQFPVHMTREPMPLESMVKRDILALSDLFEKIGTAFKAQYAYSMKENVPRGIMTLEEAGPHALQHAIAAAWNKTHEWSCSAAVDLAEAVLEDANCHTCAAALNEAAHKQELR